MNESEIPIDINSNKLLDWLISRRHVNKDWQDNILSIREKINMAIQDMPMHKEILELLSGQHINYFHCLRIIEILKETEADSKNMFGQYGSRRMKDWQDIIAGYQKNNLYLAECAQLLMRNVSYEVPSLKKHIAKCEQAKIDGEKKIKDYARGENMATNEFNAACKQLGIKGIDIKQELKSLVKQLPILHKELEGNLKSLEPAINTFQAFINFQMGKQNDSAVLPLLSYLVENGNTTTYEYVYGDKPLSIVEQVESNIEPSCESGGIDFGDNVQIDFSTISTDNEIVFDVESAAEGEIDWGAPATDDEEFEIVNMDAPLDESGIVVEKSGNDGGIAQGADALTLLDNPKTRDQLVNDLIELEAFFKMRLYEMSNSSDSLTMSQLDVPSILQMQSLEGTTALADYVSVALSSLTNKRILHLHNIKHSPKYIDVLSSSLLQKLDIVQRMQARKAVVEDNIKENNETIAKINPIVKQVIDVTKMLQRQLEQDISKKYKGRKVNIVGGVNMM